MDFMGLEHNGLTDLKAIVCITIGLLGQLSIETLYVLYLGVPTPHTWSYLESVGDELKYKRTSSYARVPWLQVLPENERINSCLNLGQR
jgi:hypothetical protein